MLISDKAVFKTEYYWAQRGTLQNYKRIIYQEYITLINVYVPKKELQNTWNKNCQDYRETDNSTTTAEDFNIPISISDRTRDKKVSKETDDLNITANHVGLIEVYGSQHPENAKYAFFSNAHGMFTKTDHTWDHRTSFNKCKRNEVT